MEKNWGDTPSATTLCKYVNSLKHESFALIRESYALIRESYAIIREKIYFFSLYENEPNSLSYCKHQNKLYLFN